MIAAERDRIRMHELAFGEDPDGGGAAAHVDERGAEFRLVVDQRRKTARIGGRHDALDRQMGTVDAQFEIAQRRHVRRHHMHRHAQGVADHAARIADPALAVEHVADRDRVEEVPFVRKRLLGTGGQHLADVGVLHLMAAEIDRRPSASRSSAGPPTC